MKVPFTGSQRKCLYFVPLKESFIIWCTAEDKISAYFPAHYYLETTTPTISS